MAESKTKMEYAIEYAERGWRVMPLHHIERGVCTCHKVACKTPAKHPRILDPLKRATTEEKQIREWWTMWPKANIAIVTGAASGVVVLDVDAKSGGSNTLKAILAERGDFPDRVMTRTGGNGFHLLFAHPGGHWPNTQGSPTVPSPIGQGLDFRGDGGYIVAPGSDHISGKQYTWATPVNGHLPAAPQWLLEKLSNRKSFTTLPTDGEAQILDGNRHNTLRAWACMLRAKGMSKAGIRAAILAENVARFAEPKPDDEVERLIEWVCKFAPGDVPDWKTPELPQQAAEEKKTVGLVSVRDVQAEMDALYRDGARRGMKTGWNALDDLYSVHPGDITIICAAPSAGKTTFGLNLVANMATLHDWKIGICSTENRVPMMLADLAGMIAGNTYYGNFPQDQMDGEQKHWVDSFLDDHFRCIQATTKEPFTMEYVLSNAKAMNADGLILDPFGALALPQQRNSNDSRAIRDLLHGVAQPFVKETGMHLWIMVHTTKLPIDKDGDMAMPTPYNATDSAGFFNAADFFFGIRRPKSKGGKITELACQKVRDRFSGEVGDCQFAFDYKTGRYSDDTELTQAPRSSFVGTEEEYQF